MAEYSRSYYVLSKHTGIDQPYHWVLKAPNHEIVLVSENYLSKNSALNGIESTKENCVDDKNYNRRTAKDGSPYFVLLAKNGQVIGNSEMYSSVQAMENGIKAVKKYGKSSTLKDESVIDSITSEPIITTESEKSTSGRYA